MIWHYFPIGMRFPVADFSEETRRACWKIALSAVFASDATQTGLYEACETFDPITQSPVYICIVCYVGIKQSRKAGAALHSLDALMTRLCLHQPLVQANTLENFGPYPILAEIDGEGRIKPTEAGAPFIPTEQPKPMQPSAGNTILIAPPFEDGSDAERVSRMVGIAAAEHGFRVRRMTVANGGTGTLRALVSGTNGRYEKVTCSDANGDRVGMLVGVIPGHIAAIEAENAVGSATISEKASAPELSSASIGELIKKTLDLGFRKIWIGLGELPIDDLGLGALHALGMRFADADGETVDPCKESVSRIARVDRSGFDPRLAETELTILYVSGTTLCGKAPVSGLEGDPDAPGSGAAGGLGFALSCAGGRLLPGEQTIHERIGLAAALKTADFYIGGSTVDTEKLTQAFPNLKGVAVCPGGEPCETKIGEWFDRSILSALSKDVANP